MSEVYFSKITHLTLPNYKTSVHCPLVQSFILCTFCFFLSGIDNRTTSLYKWKCKHKCELRQELHRSWTHVPSPVFDKLSFFVYTSLIQVHLLSLMSDPIRWRRFGQVSHPLLLFYIILKFHSRFLTQTSYLRSILQVQSCNYRSSNLSI